MPKDFSIDWDALRQAREKLAAQIGEHPEISLIDIGANPNSEDQPGPPVIRVHVRREWTQQQTPVPEQIDGIRVVVVPGNYQLE